jgi:CrcB protein
VTDAGEAAGVGAGAGGPVGPPGGAAPHRLVDLLRERRSVLGVIAAGGALGSAMRWALATTWPQAPSGLPWATLTANVTGAFALGALVAVVTMRWPTSRYRRPFWGVGVLGGYTTFSTYALEVHLLALGGQPGVAAAYALGTLLTGLPAAWLGGTVGASWAQRRGVG